MKSILRILPKNILLTTQLQRSYRVSSTLQHGARDPNAATINVNFIDRDGDLVKVQGEVGKSIMDTAHQNGIDLEGACEGSMACSTCHVFVEESFFDQLPEPEEEEEDMLDLAYDLRDNSRLGCQVILTEDLEGITVTIPSQHRNMQ